MPINKNHEFEDLDGVKCAIVEKNVSKERVEFLKSLLDFNRYEVIVVTSPAPKAVPAKAVAPVTPKVTPEATPANAPSSEPVAAPANPVVATSSNKSALVPAMVESPVTEKVVAPGAQNNMPGGDAQPKVSSPDSTSLNTPSAPPPPETFTVGVTDVTFNPINAIFGRLLKTPDGHVVTLAFWEQRENVSQDEVPYFERG